MNDYGPNGLQVEGKSQVSKIAFAVSATAESVNKAVEFGADALIVHHGLFWNFHGTKPIIGPYAKRVKPLILNDINLFGYHLPLDGNQEFGNAKIIADKLLMTELEPFGEYKRTTTGIKGKLAKPLSSVELKNLLGNILDHDIIMSTPSDDTLISAIGIITGGANSEWQLAYRQNLDAYITGEISEHDWHEAKEYGVTMLAGGHNATEKFGIQALMQKVQDNFKVECKFFDSTNPA